MGKKALLLERKNLIIDNNKLKRLQRLLRTKSQSEAVRLAIERALDAEDAISALRRLKKRGTWGKNIGI